MKLKSVGCVSVVTLFCKSYKHNSIGPAGKGVRQLNLFLRYEVLLITIEI